jgi:hypothetical protein
MLRIPILALSAAALLAQSADNPFDKPPANVDRTLRERINQFYQFHIDRQFRKAEALVAEDTKDFFYSRNKPAYVSCKVGRIQYTENYTRAKATELCEQYVMMPGFAEKPLMVPIPSTWKLVRGKWFWYVDQESLRVTPFGRMTPGATVAAGSLPAAIATSPDAFINKVQADKASVNLKPGQPEQVVIANTAPGLMNIAIVGEYPGLEAKLDHTDLEIGGKAVLTLRAGEGAKPGFLNIRVQQTGELIQIKIEVP